MRLRHGRVQGEEGAENVAQLGVRLGHGVVPHQQQAREQLGRADGADHEELAQALGNFGSQLQVWFVQHFGEDYYHRVATLKK